MFAFKLTPLGVKILFKYCNKNPLFEVLVIEEPDGDKGFVVRRAKKKGFVYVYNKFKFGELFRVEKDEIKKGLISDEEQSEDFFLYPNINLIYELEIEQLNKLIDMMELCRDKSEDDK